MARIEQYIEKSNLGLRIKKRDLDAFHELYKTSFLPLQHYAMRYLYDWKQAEDLVQDAFLSLWDHLERYDEKQPVFYYMLGIIIEAMLFSGIEDPEIDEDIHERLKTILDTLPEKQKEVVLLHIVEKKKIKEIATQMDIAETTVKTHFKRAMAILRNNLKLVLFGV